jgi:hypothetical protein
VDSSTELRYHGAVSGWFLGSFSWGDGLEIGFPKVRRQFVPFIHRHFDGVDPSPSDAHRAAILHDFADGAGKAMHDPNAVADAEAARRQFGILVSGFIG